MILLPLGRHSKKLHDKVKERMQPEGGFFIGKRERFQIGPNQRIIWSTFTEINGSKLIKNPSLRSALSIEA